MWGYLVAPTSCTTTVPTYGKTNEADVTRAGSNANVTGSHAANGGMMPDSEVDFCTVDKVESAASVHERKG